MSKRDGHQKGAQAHAEGQHGEKTRSRQKEILQGAAHEETADPVESKHDAPGGHHRLAEDRQQHDEAEKNSEKKRTPEAPSRNTKGGG